MNYKQEAGQAMPLGIALLLVGVLGGLVLYNTGQSATTKTRLANTADAAAYSGMQWQARALNFAGYTNRAMVANQVSMAQAVTLTSWSTYGMIMSENLARVLSAIPVVNAIAQGVSTVMVTINNIIDPITEAMLSVINGVNRGVSIAQNAMYQSSYLATPEIVMAVVEQSDPDFSSATAYTAGGVLGNLNDWRTFSSTVTNEQDDYDNMRERADIIRESQDAFTRARNWSFFDGFLYIGPMIKVDLKKEGETRLIEREGENGLEWEWKAKDNLGFHTKVYVPFSGWKGVEIPVGYGLAIGNAVDDVTLEEGACTQYSELGDCVTWARYNSTSEALADVNTPSLNGSDSRVEMDGYSGLNTFRRLSDEVIEGRFPTLKLRVEVKTDSDAVDSSNDFVSGDEFTTPTAMPGSAMSAISIAEVYFKPPDADRTSADQDIEFANLYSPWWDVRLAPVPAADRLAAFALRAGADGLSTSPGVVPGAAGGGNGQAQTSGADAGLADALGLDGTAATDAIMDSALEAGGAAGQEAIDAARDAFGDAADAAADQITEALADVLEDAVREILNGIVSDATGGTVTADDLESWAEGISADTAEDETVISENIDGALTEVQAMQDEFERLNTVVNERFTEVFEQELIDYRTRTDGLRAVVAGYLGRPVGLFERVSDAQLSDTERDNAQHLRSELNTFIADLAVAYRDIVNEETDRFEMTFEMARDYVVTALATYDEHAGDIDWSVFSDELVEESMATPEPATDDNVEPVNE